MYCSNCGRFVEEGKAFCKNCGAPVPKPPDAPAEQEAPTERPPLQTEPHPAPSATEEGGIPPAVREFSPPPPPPPPAVGYGSDYSRQPVPGPTGSRSRTGLIVGIMAAVIVVLAGAGVGAYFAFFRDGDVATETVTAAVSSSTTREEPDVTSSSIIEEPGITTEASTAQTIPALTTTTAGSSATGGPSVSGGPSAAYLRAVDALVAELDYDDRRIPELATEINTSAPGVPVWVRDELSLMLGSLDNSNTELAALDVPRGFEDSYSWLEEAALHMGNRLHATIQGIEAIWDAGEVSTEAAGFFDEGRNERDAYREALQRYYGSLPVH